MGVEVSHNDFVNKIYKEVESGHEIGRTGGVREYVNEDVDGDFLDIDCYGEEFSGVVLRG